jgi:hypothetical protein
MWSVCVYRPVLSVKLSSFGRAILIIALCALGAYLLLFRLPRARNLARQPYVLDAYPIEFRQDGTVLRGPWQGRYQQMGDNLICLGGWERRAGGGNLYSTPRGLFSFALSDRDISLTPVSSGAACPPWAATAPAGAATPG